LELEENANLNKIYKCIHEPKLNIKKITPKEEETVKKLTPSKLQHIEDIPPLHNASSRSLVYNNGSEKSSLNNINHVETPVSIECESNTAIPE